MFPLIQLIPSIGLTAEFSNCETLDCVKSQTYENPNLISLSVSSGCFKQLFNHLFKKNQYASLQTKKTNKTNVSIMENCLRPNNLKNKIINTWQNFWSPNCHPAPVDVISYYLNSIKNGTRHPSQSSMKCSLYFNTGNTLYNEPYYKKSILTISHAGNVLKIDADHWINHFNMNQTVDVGSVEGQEAINNLINYINTAIAIKPPIVSK